MGCLQDRGRRVRSQGASRSPSPRTRLCLLKTCERSFRPKTPASRYCGAGCSSEARLWAQWRSRQTYRASERGKACRQAQAARRRERKKRAAEASVSAGEILAPAGPQVSEGAGESLAPPPEPPEEDSEPARDVGVGHRYGDFCGCLCDRPGCYVSFPRDPKRRTRRYCSSACRRACRLVILRERRWGLPIAWRATLDRSLRPRERLRPP